MTDRRGAVAADRGLSGEALQEGHPQRGSEVHLIGVRVKDIDSLL